jgi:hypothetical protein
VRRRSRLLAVLAGVLVVASVWYVTAPPRGVADYRERAAQTADKLRSHVQSARLWVRTLDGDRTLRSSAAVGFREAEDDAVTDASRFAGYDPPAGTDGLRSDLTKLSSDVEDALAALRIVTQRDEWSRVPATGAPLAELSKRLDRFAKGARR